MSKENNGKKRGEKESVCVCDKKDKETQTHTHTERHRERKKEKLIFIRSNGKYEPVRGCENNLT